MTPRTLLQCFFAIPTFPLPTSSHTSPHTHLLPSHLASSSPTYRNLIINPLIYGYFIHNTLHTHTLYPPPPLSPSVSTPRACMCAHAPLVGPPPLEAHHARYCSFLLSVYICLFSFFSTYSSPTRGCSSVGLVCPRILLYYHSAPSWTCSIGGILSLHPAGWRAGGAGPG
ncbi:uncharacterized protein SCHCODRAFT_01244863 [Schizophyllum commune H4-8]|uniref:uncharacterized protein n=1 Tax=Schizophyllum commune (strain H4-8 / FGSC 9210) TaxID=578458 RepID=UPI00215EB2F7|nr:uncharacterized protein SCHCODRAFT_01244863 [Schizophyllum commune H4-8]KAI5887014.1 hypothetical protein SCHCODRAFT_01244863 [Schizophyllum commune H4-8]